MQSQIEQMSELSTQIHFLYSEWAKKQGINFNVLAVFYTIHKYQQCTQKQVCTEWIVPKQTMSTLCKQLSDEGYITFTQGTDDKREKMMTFTEQGRAYALPILNNLAQLEQAILRELGEKEMQQMVSSMKRFTEIFVRVA